MKYKGLVELGLFIGFFFLSFAINAQSFPKIVGPGVWGPEEAQAGMICTYKIEWDMNPHLVTLGDKQIITWEVEGGAIMEANGNIPSVKIKWNTGIAQGKITAKTVKDMSIQNVKNLSCTVTMFVPKQPFEPDDPSYKGDLLIFNVSNKNPKKFEFISLNLIERYWATPRAVEWTIDGVRYDDNTLSRDIYFPTAGTKNISARIYFYGVSDTRSISTSVVVGDGVPDLTSDDIVGPTKIGVGSQANYSILGYSEKDVEYSWVVFPGKQNIIDNLGSTIIVEFLTAARYSIRCQAKDKRTNALGKQAVKAVIVSPDYGVLDTNPDQFTVALENSNLLKIISVSTFAPFISDPMPYRLCNVNTGVVVSTGFINNQQDTKIDVHSLPKGIYILYIQLDSEKIETHKLFINK